MRNYNLITMRNYNPEVLLLLMSIKKPRISLPLHKMIPIEYFVLRHQPADRFI